MPLATRTGIDSAGGLLATGGQQTVVTIDGATWAIVGQAVTDHGAGAHDAATMSTGSAFVTIDGVAVCLAGNLATCGHAATGSGPVTLSG